MSWIFGVIAGDPSSPLLSRCSSIHSPPLHTFRAKNLYIAAGGITATCQWGQFPDSRNHGWIVVGCGIELGPNAASQLMPERWSELLSGNNPALTNIDGHFLAVTWDDSTVRCFNDLFGLRTLYVTQIEDSVAFSTRLDWIAKTKKGLEVDFESFGPHWLTYNQLSHDSLVKGVSRLAPCSSATLTADSISIRSDPWTPDLSTRDPEEMITVLTKLLRFKSNENLALSMGLSGGLDSRVLLSVLASENIQGYQLHLFGHPDEPDVRIARRIVRDFSFKQELLFETIPPMDECILRATEYIAQTHLIEPVSSFIKLGGYSALHRMGRYVIDGGMGEIARRQFLTRLRLRGVRTNGAGEPSKIYNSIRHLRAPIFSVETMMAMREGVEKQIAKVWRGTPSPGSLGEENFLDFLIVRYRFPNYGGIEQSRTDEHALSFMPFAQPSFVRVAFGLPLRVKRNARLYRRLIRQRCPALAKYPLVKGTAEYPFILPTIPALLWTKGQTVLGREFQDPTPAEFLLRIRDFVYDFLSSADVKSYSPYDHRAITRIVDEFYNGKIEMASHLDWWLAFELWRRMLKG